MLHKKQSYFQIERTLDWNTNRGNTPETLDWELEVAMLQEELDELKAATTDVDRFDALLDLKFVLTGSLGKMALTPPQIVSGYESVILANEMKGTQKSPSGKITKPDGWEQFAPEPHLQKILDSRKDI